MGGDCCVHNVDKKWMNKRIKEQFFFSGGWWWVRMKNS